MRTARSPKSTPQPLSTLVKSFLIFSPFLLSMSARSSYLNYGNNVIFWSVVSLNLFNKCENSNCRYLVLFCYRYLQKQENKRTFYYIYKIREYTKRVSKTSVFPSNEIYLSEQVLFIHGHLTFNRKGYESKSIYAFKVTQYMNSLI